MRYLIIISCLLLVASCHSNKDRLTGQIKTETTSFKTKRDSLLKVSFADLKNLENVSKASAYFTNAEFATNDDLLGFGYNASTQTPTGLLLDLSKCTIDTDTAKGQFVDKTFDHITSLSQFYEKLGLDIRASAKVGGFKGSAAYSLAQSTEINSFSDYLLIRVVVRNSPTTIQKAFINEQAVKLAKSQKAVFLERFGDEFFYSKTTGGEFDCLFQFTSNSNEYKRQTSAAIDAAYKTFLTNFSVSAAINTINNSLTQNTRVIYKIIRNGDTGYINDTNTDSLAKYADAFPEKVKTYNHPVVISMASKAIIYAVNPGALRARDFKTIREQKYFLDDVARLLVQLKEANANYRFALDPENQDIFGDTVLKPLRSYIQTNESAITKLQKIYDDCQSSPAGCKVDFKKGLQYQTAVPSSQFSATNPRRVAPIKLDLSDDPGLKEQYFITINSNRVATLEVKGQWKLRNYPLPGSNLQIFAPPVCDVPWEETPPAPNPPITKSAVLVIAKDILDNSVVQQYILNKNRPLTIPGGVKIFLRPQYPVQNCDPPVSVISY